MAYRRLLLPLTGTAAGEAALATALMTARLWNAHVHCLHVRVDARDVAPLAGEGLSGAMIEEMMAATERESGERASRVRELFQRVIGSAGGDITLADSAETALKTNGPTLSFESIPGREEDKKDPHAFIGWGTGRHPCLGMRVSLLSVSSFFLVLLLLSLLLLLLLSVSHVVASL